MRHWAEAAVGRRQLARAMRRLSVDGFEARDVLIDGDSAQHSDRLLVGPQGLYVAGFRMLPGNIWRGGRAEPSGETLAAHAGATQRLADVVSASLLADLSRLHLTVRPLLTIIGPEQPPDARIGGVPLVGPAGFLAELTGGPRVLSRMQIDSLVDRVDDWLALRSVTGLHARRGRPGSGRGRRGSL